MRILVTGGAGYIGAHVLVELLLAGHDVVVVDDFSAGHDEALHRVCRLTRRRLHLIRGDIGDPRVASRGVSGVEAVLHLAASKKVGESVARPGMYFRNNVGAMATLLEEMDKAGVRNIVFSSTAAVYGSGQLMPLREDARVAPDSPYGLSKAMGETMLAEMAVRKGWSAVSLRYFNPVGAHESAEIGEPLAAAASLVPCALRALATAGDPLTVFGTDYHTPDGTCLRDYIHVTDLALAHLAALRVVGRPGHHVFNVGTGRPYSVRDVLASCQRVTGREVPHADGPRRPGDVPVAQADPSLFERETGFVARRGLDEMVESAWQWWLRHPEGYGAQRQSPTGFVAPRLVRDAHATAK